MRGLEALQRLRDNDYSNKYPKGKLCKIITNELKVLEIIKNKCVDMFNLKIAILQNSVDVYNSSIGIEYEGNKLTQDEFNLLKEVVR